MAVGGEGVGSGCHGDWKRVQAVAQIISRCPSQVPSLSHYYSTIGPQVHKTFIKSKTKLHSLLHEIRGSISPQIFCCVASNFSSVQLLKLLSVAGRATVLVSAATLSLMMKTQPALTRSHVVLPLTAPLRAIAAGLLARAPSLPFC